jgi:3-oxoacyl-[acyl-carrier protein] reductase
VNNAGVLKTVPLAATSDALYDQTFDINVRGTFNTLREAAARMNEGGRIVNFSSTTLALNMPGYAIYNATKAAVEAFTHVFFKELRGRNITVNAKSGGLIVKGQVDQQLPKSPNARNFPNRQALPQAALHVTTARFCTCLPGESAAASSD